MVELGLGLGLYLVRQRGFGVDEVLRVVRVQSQHGTRAVGERRPLSRRGVDHLGTGVKARVSAKGLG